MKPSSSLLRFGKDDTMARRTTMGLVRAGISGTRGDGFIVTWDVDSRDRSVVDRVWTFIWGKTVTNNGRKYIYEGFVHRPGVRYLGQSVLFVKPVRVAELLNFLEKCGVEHSMDRIIFP